MVKKTLFVCALVLWFCPGAGAQSYEWLIGGGGYEDMSPTANYEQIHHICTDDNGNTYVTAITGAIGIHADTFYMAIAHNISPSIPHILLASYDCAGHMRWAKMLEAYNYTYVSGVVYSDGAIYVGGCLEGNNKHVGYDTTISTYYLSSFTLKVDTSGTFDWIRFIGEDTPATSVSAYDRGVIAIDRQGDIHNFSYIKAGCPVTTSLTTTESGTYDLRYDPSGNLMSITHIAALDSIWGLINVKFSLTADKFYAALGPGQKWYYTYTDYEYAVAAFDAADNMIWTDTTTMGSQGFVSKIAYDGNNRIYAAGGGAVGSTYSLGGIASSTAYGADFGTVYALDTNGVAHWAYDLPSVTELQNMTDIALLPNHNIGLTGFYVGEMRNGSDSLVTPPGELNNPYLLILDSSGHVVKLDQLHGPGFDDYGVAIAADNLGNLYLGGCLNTTLTATGLTPFVAYGGNTDFYLAKYGYACGCVAPTAFFTALGAPTVSFTYGGSAGYDSLRWYFGDGGTSTDTNPVHLYAAEGTYHACLYVYTLCGTDSFCADQVIIVTLANSTAQATLRIYPNPGKDALYIEGTAPGTTISLTDMTGRELYTAITPAAHAKIDIHTLANGPYMLRITDHNKNPKTVMVLKN